MDILQKLNIKLYINGKLLNPKTTTGQHATCAISPPIGLQELTREQKQKLDKLIDYEKKRFEAVTGVTSITKHEIRL